MSKALAKEVSPADATRLALAKLKGMSKAELLETLVRSKIVTPTGRLTKTYRVESTPARPRR